MIDYRFVQKAREQSGIPEETIEKDYVIELLLGYLCRDAYLNERLVFRGGTAIKKIYFPGFRYSEDLDFITGYHGCLDAFVDRFKKSIERIETDLPVELEQRVLFPQKGHLQLFVSYEIVPEIRAEKELKIDVVEDDVVLSSRLRKVMFSFADFIRLTRSINTYDLESIVAEKIGRILDVVDEPRDLWDLRYILSRKMRGTAVKKLFREKYGVDLYMPNLQSAIRKSNYEAIWEIRLKNQVMDLIPYKELVKDLELLIENKIGD